MSREPSLVRQRHIKLQRHKRHTAAAAVIFVSQTELAYKLQAAIQASAHGF